MKKFNRTFAEYSDEDFAEYSNDIIVNMRKTNKEYLRLWEKRKKLKEDYPKLELLCDEYTIPKITKLTRKEVYALRDYFDVIYDMHYMEYQEMFRVGKREEYFELKSLGILK